VGWVKNFYIRTFGCTANKSDSETIVALLEKGGYKQSNLKDADFIIVNTCGVKAPTEERVMNLLKSVAKLKKKLIIAGCLPKINSERIKREIPKFSAMLDPQSIDKIVEVIKKIENGYEEIIEFSNKPPAKPLLPKKLMNPVIGIVPIAEGCNLSCSYCCTRFARGRLECFLPEQIVESVKRLTKEGCKEIQITSQDNAQYCFNGISLPQLLNKICEVEGKFFVRVGMMNPLFTKEILDELVNSYRNEKIFKFLHLPIQSFNSRILSLMRRGYEPEDVMKILNKFFKEISNLTLETDVIVGFPTESDEEFQQTLNFIEKVKPDVVNISKFAPRPKTEASKFKLLPAKIVKKRSREIFELCKKISLEKNEKWIDWEGECLIDEKGTKKNTWMGRNFAYKPIVIRSDKNIFGKFLNVKIVDAKTNYLIGEIKE
jgi:MiaB-like tRNA modifying enzyme